MVYTNVIWQSSGSNVSAYYQTAGSSTAFQVNGVAVSSSATINFENGTDITVSNPSAGNVQFAFTGQLATTFSPVTNEFLTAYSASTGLFTASTVAYSGITGTPQLPTTFSPVTNEFITSYDQSTGLFTASTVAYSGITGTPTLAQTFMAVTSEWLNSYSATTGLFTASQPAFTDISGTVGVGQLSGTYNISISGTSSTITGTITYSQVTGTPQLAQTFSPVTHEFITSYDATTGLFTAAQPAYSDISGTPNLSVYALLAGATFSGAVAVPSISITGTLTDGSSSVGTNGQYLSSTGSATKWVSPPVTSYATTIGDGVTLAYTITHNLGTEDIAVEVYNISTGETDIVDVDRTSTNAITVTFAVAPSTNSERVVVLSSGGTATSGGGGIYPTLTPPVSTNFTWHNPSSFPETTTDYPTKMLVVLPTIATGLWLVQNAALPATPYTVDIGTMYFASNNINVVSILLSNSGLTNARVFGSRVDSDSATGYGAWTIVDQSWSGPTAPGTENVIYTADGMSASQHIVFTRVTNDGTNLNIYWSANGENYIFLETIAVSGLGFTPASTGIVFYNTSGAMNVWCYHWAVSGSILPQNS